MKFVDQTDFSNNKGDCRAACLATILGLPLSEVPNFGATVPAGDDWQKEQNAWMAEHFGLVTLTLDLNEDGSIPAINSLVNGIPCIISGDSPRGDFSHAVVGEYKMMNDPKLGPVHQIGWVHDPHPSRDYLIKAISIDLFVSVRPWESICRLRRPS